MSAIYGGNGYNRLFSQTSSVTIANSTAETTAFGAGQGNLTLPANFFSVGRVLKFSMLGVHSASGNPTIRARIYLGSMLILDTGAVASSNSTNAVWESRTLITCRSIGASGSVYGTGFYEEDDSNASPFGMPDLSPVTINTTSALTMNFTLQWGTAAAANSTTCSNVLIEGIG